ncbi:hypothetical protein DFJ73DRAFT_30506 [Zopfochytrium polystomum]|nr:hypothetical protein DFJ73DRAFT_30506 [Zopfochytrium polystomum]
MHCVVSVLAVAALHQAACAMTTVYAVSPGAVGAAASSSAASASLGGPTGISPSTVATVATVLAIVVVGWVAWRSQHSAFDRPLTAPPPAPSPLAVRPRNPIAANNGNARPEAATEAQSSPEGHAIATPDSFIEEKTATKVSAAPSVKETDSISSIRADLLDACCENDLIQLKAVISSLESTSTGNSLETIVGNAWQDVPGRTGSCIMNAVTSGNYEILEYLLTIPAFAEEVNTLNIAHPRETPLLAAIHKRLDPKFFQLLIEHGAKSHGTSRSHNPYLLEAAAIPGVETFALLTENIAANGHTAVLSKVLGDAKKLSLEQIRVLIKHGARLPNASAVRDMISTNSVAKLRLLIPLLDFEDTYELVGDSFEPNMKDILVVRHIPPHASENDVFEFFSSSGDLVFVYLRKRIAFLCFAKAESLEESLKRNGCLFKGSTLSIEQWNGVRFALPPEKKEALLEHERKARSQFVPTEVASSIFHEAAKHGNSQAVQLILDRFGSHPQFNINMIDDEGRSPLDCALQKSRTDIASLFIAHSADPSAPSIGTGRTPLFEATSNDNVKLAKFLISMGADPNVSSKVVRGSKERQEYPVHAARSIKMFNLLNEAGADFAVRSEPHRRLALHWVCKSRNMRTGLTDRLIAVLTGADMPDIWRSGRDAKGRTALHYVVLAPTKDSTLEDLATVVCGELLRAGIAYRVTDNEGRTAGDIAVGGCKAMLENWTRPSPVDSLARMCVRALKQERILVTSAGPRVMELLYGSGFGNSQYVGAGGKVDLGFTKVKLKKKSEVSTTSLPALVEGVTEKAEGNDVTATQPSADTARLPSSTAPDEVAEEEGASEEGNGSESETPPPSNPTPAATSSSSKPSSPLFGVGNRVHAPSSRAGGVRAVNRSRAQKNRRDYSSSVTRGADETTTGGESNITTAADHGQPSSSSSSDPSPFATAMAGFGNGGGTTSFTFAVAIPRDVVAPPQFE